eukprot:gnl/TRDRNA2_/TRDRNA2_91050_c0_seq1.p1 gnl/TRDRNA2_/TRDRNA2_91050_c0~~gnl/TRDRNA2_/TRDRNA2_91050_c0_seq1.p1  ORF type:complete len:408 (-),score=53.14 gnl/TRDRNA2_/TRDRNA2_91050_c0_seq1:77-1300(-)
MMDTQLLEAQVAEHSDFVLPAAGVAMAVLAWGSFTAPMKAKSVSAVQLDPVVFQLYMSLGILLSSNLTLLLPDVPLAWTWWSLLSASMWVPASLLCVLCVRDIGIALGQSVWSGTVAVVSFLWGQLYFRDGMNSPVAGSGGLVLLVGGIGALGAISGSAAPRAVGKDEGKAPCSTHRSISEVRPLKLGANSDASAEERELVETAAESSRRDCSTRSAAPETLPSDCELVHARADAGDAPEKITATDSVHRVHRRRGLCLALTIGLGAGSTMVPLRLAPRVPFRDGVHALSFAVCFGVSVMAVTALIFAFYVLWRREVPAMHVDSCLLPAMISGLLWNIGNVGAILSVLPPLGLTVGYPSTQACLLISGLWGIWYYKEVGQPLSIGLFFLAAIVVLVGAGLLGVYGTA